MILRMVAVLESLGSWLFRRSQVSLLCVLLVLLVLKVGVAWETYNIETFFLPASQALPVPVDWYSASVGHLAIPRLLGINSLQAWVALYAFLVLGVLACAAFLGTRTRGVPPGAVLLFVMSTTGVATTLVTLGKYDALTLFGAILLGLGRSHATAFVGALVMALGNPEQAVVAALALLLVSLAVELRFWRARALIALITSTASWALVQVWMLSSGVWGNRLSLLSVWLQDSLDRVLRSPFNEIWSWFGMAWIVVFAVLIAVGRRSRVMVFLGLVVVPGLVTVITADGARVFGLVSLPALLAVALFAWESLPNSETIRLRVVGGYFLAWVAVPILVVNWSVFQGFGNDVVARVIGPITFWYDALWYYLVSSRF